MAGPFTSPVHSSYDTFATSQAAVHEMSTVNSINAWDRLPFCTCDQLRYDGLWQQSLPSRHGKHHQPWCIDRPVSCWRSPAKISWELIAGRMHNNVTWNSICHCSLRCYLAVFPKSISHTVWMQGMYNAAALHNERCCWQIVLLCSLWCSCSWSAGAYIYHDSNKTSCERQWTRQGQEHEQYLGLLQHLCLWSDQHTRAKLPQRYSVPAGSIRAYR